MTARIMSAAACFVGLCSCGGGDSDAGSTVPVVPGPTPTTSPTPTPTPTPQFSYTRIEDISGSRDLASGSVMYGTSTSNPSVFPALLQASFYRTFVEASYNGSSGTYVIGRQGTSEAQAFGSMDAVASSDPAVQSFVRVVDGQTRRASVYTPWSDGRAFSYSRLAIYRRPDSNPNSYAAYTNYYFLGVPTDGADLPGATGLAYTKGIVVGEAFRLVDGRTIRYDLLGSTASASISPATGAVTSTVNLRGRTTDGAIFDFGTYTVEAPVVQSKAGYGLASTGAFSGERGGFTVEGGFFGPQGVETAYSFQVSRLIGNSLSDRDLSIVGDVALTR